MPARLFVLAGVNGAGKSSLGGAAIQANGAEFFNPDIAAARLREQQAGLTAAQAEPPAAGATRPDRPAEPVIAAPGPAMYWPRSTTRTPARGRDGACPEGWRIGTCPR